MSKSVQKLNQLKNPESFLQAHTVKGFKYIDRAGEIVNLYHQNGVIPKFNMNLDGLVIEQPIDKVSQLKITPTFVWMKFTEIDTLDNISRIFSVELKKICAILDIELVSRIGWRSYFIYEFKKQQELKNFQKKTELVDKSELEIAKLKLNTGQNFEASIIPQLVIKSDDNDQKGLLIDLDVFEKGQVKVTEIPAKLRQFREYCLDENGFLKVVNELIL